MIDTTLVDDIVALTEEIYPQYLKDMELEDSPVIKFVYYQEGLKTIREDPLPDPILQKMLLIRLQIIMLKIQTEEKLQFATVKI